jgi:hypothetical protein
VLFTGGLLTFEDEEGGGSLAGIRFSYAYQNSHATGRSVILQKGRFDRKRAIRMPWFAKVSRRIQRQLRIVAEETENRKPIRRG